jgi:NitT/TauT family transport system permease protein
MENIVKKPLLQNPAVVKIVAPLIVGVFLLTIWQILCVMWKVPIYLVPKPTDPACCAHSA